MDRKLKYFDIFFYFLDNINLDYQEMFDVICVKEYYKYGLYLIYGLFYIFLFNVYYLRVKNMF